MTDERLAAEIAKWLQHRVDSGLAKNVISAFADLFMKVQRIYFKVPFQD